MTRQLMSVSRPATAVMFLMARMLGGPGGEERQAVWLAGDGQARPCQARLSHLASESIWGREFGGGAGTGLVTGLEAEAGPGVPVVSPGLSAFKQQEADRCLSGLGQGPGPRLGGDGWDLGGVLTQEEMKIWGVKMEMWRLIFI